MTALHRQATSKATAHEPFSGPFVASSGLLSEESLGTNYGRYAHGGSSAHTHFSTAA